MSAGLERAEYDSPETAVARIVLELLMPELFQFDAGRIEGKLDDAQICGSVRIVMCKWCRHGPHRGAGLAAGDTFFIAGGARVKVTTHHLHKLAVVFDQDAK